MALKKNKESEYSFKGTETKDCYFMDNEIGESVCLVNNFNKTVSTCHGYCHPNKEAKRIEKFAKKLGYKYVTY